MYLSDVARKRDPQKRGRPRRKKKKVEEESSAEAPQQNEEVIVEKPAPHDGNPEQHEEMPGDSAELPESCDVDTPDEVPCDEGITKMSFSDDDMDMNVDFDLGIETGDDDDDDDANDVGAEPDDDDDDDYDGGHPEQRVETDTARCAETKHQTNQQSVLDSSRGTAVQNPGELAAL